MTSPPDQPSVFTIGHSNHEWDSFVALLRRHGVCVVADVRSSPFSRFSPQFNREPLAACLKSAGFEYLFLGRELGARRCEPACYVDRQARYDLIARSPLFLEGLDRVRDQARSRRVALMCAEKDPITCHRMVLVCRALRDGSLAIRHILEDGSLESTQEAETRLLAATDLPESDLFRTRDELVEEAYERQGRRIAWVESEDAETGVAGPLRSGGPWT